LIMAVVSLLVAWVVHTMIEKVAMWPG
jgi:hypothetical protein